jgi:hypothetical protein
MTLPALDHLVIDVGDNLDQAAATYRALGFQLTERGYHTLGSANHLAMFETNYIELLAARQSGGPIRSELAGFPPGLNGLVLATDDADAQYNDLRERGVAVRAPESFSRPVTLADGVTHDARFRTTHLGRSAVPFGRLYFCQHDTRDLVWRPEWQRHPNGAREITGVLISAPDPEQVAALFQRMFGTEPAEIGGGSLRVFAGQVAIDIARHPELAAEAKGRDVFLAAIRLRVASLRQAAETLGARQRRLSAPLPNREMVAWLFQRRRPGTWHWSSRSSKLDAERSLRSGSA